MSKEYLTRAQAGTKIGASFSGTASDFVTKKELMAVGHINTGLLSAYPEGDYVVDDDIQIGKCYICSGENDFRPLNLADQIQLNMPVNGENIFWLSLPASQIVDIQCRLFGTWQGKTTQPTNNGSPSLSMPSLLFAGNVRYFKIFRTTSTPPNIEIPLKFYINGIEYIMKIYFTT